jgi:hypothetical protein
MGRACSTNGRDVEEIKGSGWAPRKEKTTNLEDVSVYVRIILK